jgi:hypothetical protein
MFIGNCPYCQDGKIFVSKKNIQGKTVKFYSCSNYSVTTEDGEIWEKTENSTCSFHIFGNSLLRYGKRGIGIGEVKRLLRQEDVIVKLYSYRVKKDYYKYLILDKNYGVSIDWDTQVEEKNH